jgi:hypothetical protein
MVQSISEDFAGCDDLLAPPDLPPNIRSGLPSETWTAEELAERAVWEYGRVAGVPTDAASYWPLGKLFLFVRRPFKKGDGQWTRWRRARNIDRTLAQRAQLFARAFKSPKQLRGMPIDKATALANERLGDQPGRPALDAKIRRWLRQTAKAAALKLDEFRRVESRAKLLPIIDELARVFEQFRGACRQPPRPRVKPK